eukprot:3107841-Rhodomonas_salina.1
MVEQNPKQGSGQSFRDLLRTNVGDLDKERGNALDKEQIDLYLDDMTASRHRNLVTGEDESTPEASVRAAAERAYDVIKWRSESPWSPKMVSPDRPSLLQKLGKMYIRPGSSLRKTVVYVRAWLDPDPHNVKASILDIVHVAEMARLAAQHGTGKIVLITDLSGLDFDVRIGRLAATLLQNNFPNLLEAACLVNIPPHARSFVNCMLALLEPETRAKFRIFDSAPFGTTLGRTVHKDIQHAIKETIGEQVRDQLKAAFASLSATVNVLIIVQDVELDFGGWDKSFQQKRRAFESDSQSSHNSSCAHSFNGADSRADHLLCRLLQRRVSRPSQCNQSGLDHVLLCV